MQKLKCKTSGLCAGQFFGLEGELHQLFVGLSVFIFVAGKLFGVT